MGFVGLITLIHLRELAVIKEIFHNDHVHLSDFGPPRLLILVVIALVRDLVATENFSEQSRALKRI